MDEEVETQIDERTTVDDMQWTAQLGRAMRALRDHLSVREASFLLKAVGSGDDPVLRGAIDRLASGSLAMDAFTKILYVVAKSRAAAAATPLPMINDRGEDEKEDGDDDDNDHEEEEEEEEERDEEEVEDDDEEEEREATGEEVRGGADKKENGYGQVVGDHRQFLHFLARCVIEGTLEAEEAAVLGTTG